MNKTYENHIVIILAGGQSSRAETIKGLRKVNNAYWIDHHIQYFQNIGMKNIYIGLGYDHEKYLKQSHFLKNNKTQVIINKTPEKGSFSTLKHVLKQVQNLSWDYAIVLHIDHALPTDQLINELTQKTHYFVVKPTYKGKSGHPIMLSQECTKYLIQQPDSSQLNKEIRKLPIEKIFWLPINTETILYNLNTKKQWMNYLTRSFHQTDKLG